MHYGDNVVRSNKKFSGSETLSLLQNFVVSQHISGMVYGIMVQCTCYSDAMSR